MMCKCACAVLVVLVVWRVGAKLDSAKHCTYIIPDGVKCQILVDYVGLRVTHTQGTVYVHGIVCLGAVVHGSIDVSINREIAGWIFRVLPIWLNLYGLRVFPPFEPSSHNRNITILGLAQNEQNIVYLKVRLAQK